MRILCASVTNAPASILSPHLQTLHQQRICDETELDFLYVLDPEAPQETAETLEATGVTILLGEAKPDGANYSVSSQTHNWSVPTFRWLGRQKDRLIQHAREQRYDGLFLVDSDLLLGPDTLASLISAQKPVVSAVFWTRWSPADPPLPQVWLSHPYGFSGKGMESHEFFSRLYNRGLVPCGGLGAATLIRSVVFPKVSFAPVGDVPSGGMSQGEDRHFCIRAERNYVELWADAWPDIFHVYRPEDVQRIPDMLQKVDTSTEVPTFGHLVSFTLEACEEPALAGHVEHIRGRLGQLRLLPDIENAISTMKVGDEQFLSVRFPEGYPIPQYRNSKRILRLRLLGAKPYSLPPVLADAA